MGLLNTHLIGDPARLRIGVASVATLIGVLGIVLEGLIPAATSEILNIELLVLPLVYIVGNEMMEDVIKKKNEGDLLELRALFEETVREKFGPSQRGNVKKRGKRR